MNYPRYEYSAENDLNIFEFESVDTKIERTTIIALISKIVDRADFAIIKVELGKYM